MLENRPGSPFADTAIVLLAAGRSSRFAAGDKLMAPYGGAPLIARSARLLRDEASAARIAVVGEGQHARAEALIGMDWSVSVCNAALPSMAISLVHGIRRAEEIGAKAALILLADMPEVRDDHLLALRTGLTSERSAALSRNGDILMPPAIFRREVFPALLGLRGDQGARGLFGALPGLVMIDIDPRQAIDIDTVADLERAEKDPVASWPAP